jgi:hypothetical protein
MWRALTLGERSMRVWADAGVAIAKATAAATGRTNLGIVGTGLRGGDVITGADRRIVAVRSGPAHAAFMSS